MTVNSRFLNVSYITVYITAGQRPYCSFDFSKYFLLGSIQTPRAEINNGGSWLLTGQRFCLTGLTCG
jgi:hypothetical protein